MEDILFRIKEFRKKKGFTYENMASELNTSSAAYRKIELNQTKLTVDRLYQIAKIVDAKIEDLLGIKADKYFKQEVNENSTGYQDVQNLYYESKEFVDKLELNFKETINDKNSVIKEKDYIISHLKNIIDSYNK